MAKNPKSKMAAAAILDFVNSEILGGGYIPGSAWLTNR